MFAATRRFRWWWAGLLVVSAMLGATPLRAQVLHAVIASDTSDWAGWGKYLPNITLDVTYMYSILHANLPERNLRYLPVEIFENDMGRPEYILGALQKLRPGPQDVVLFYFTGHGAVDDRGHYFELAHGKLYREDVRQLLENKGARLVVLLTDCCNARSDGKLMMAPAPYAERPARISPLFRALFFTSRGVVDINGSSPGESAFLTPDFEETGELPGSLFTKTLSNYVEQNSHRALTWDTVVRELAVGVHLAFRRAYPQGATIGKGAGKQNDQNVFAAAYPGMPANQGPRTGLAVREHDGRGAMIIQVAAGFPATQVYDIQAERYVSLAPGQLIVEANGQPVQGPVELREIIDASPQILRLTIRDAAGVREVLMRMRY